MLHHIFQRQGIPPDEFYAKPHKVRAFMLVSMMVQLEDEHGAVEGDREESKPETRLMRARKSPAKTGGERGARHGRR